MSTPLYSVNVREVFSRAVVLGLSPMAADPAAEELSHDFALQLLLEAHQHAGSRPSTPEEAAVFDDLSAWMFPRTLTLPAGDPAAQRIASLGEYEGRALLSTTVLPGGVAFHLERCYRAFCSAAGYYIYDVAPTVETHSTGEEGRFVTLAVVGRLPWLFSPLRPGAHWESTAFSFEKIT